MSRQKTLVVSAVALTTALLFGAVAGVSAYGQRDGEYWCITDSMSLAGLDASSLLAPEMPPEAEWQWWPMGVACSWGTTAGVERVAPTWELTLAAVVSMASLGVFLVTASKSLMRGNQRDEDDEDDEDDVRATSRDGARR